MTVPQPEDYTRFCRLFEDLKSRAKPFSGSAYRSVSTKYFSSDSIISGAGAAYFGARWNPRDIKAVYACLELDTATEEWLAQVEKYGLVPSNLPRVFLELRLTLSHLLDLCDGNLRQHIRVSRQRMLECDWQREQDAGQEALTQRLGRAARACGYEGLLVPSAVAPSRVNIVVFPDRLIESSRLDPVVSS